MAKAPVKSPPERSRPYRPHKLETLNFKVTDDFKKAFKGYAVAQGISMVELLREGFELSKARRTK
ncbi:hypothetical protein [Asticcacaulis sp. AND118]|uniref:hypothetical protein n=1 Tax=Asticcacaulis sp. AND118 TaxID=2840468 RepID=UPI001CFF710E|nr:hypothetical protein [Asticcacaulis sp. AND118]UDF05760.1 hypothetical protein LH365_18555 [Asticcacaulis sp. AND118]